MERTDTLYQTYVQILKEELVPAMGCTEPIALAYCCLLYTSQKQSDHFNHLIY